MHKKIHAIYRTPSNFPFSKGEGLLNFAKKEIIPRLAKGG